MLDPCRRSFFEAMGSVFCRKVAVFAFAVLLSSSFLRRPSAAVLFNGSTAAALPGIDIPSHPNFNAVDAAAAGSSCYHQRLGPAAAGDLHARPPSPSPAMKVHLKRRPAAATEEKTTTQVADSVMETTHRDLSRIHTFYRRITEKKNRIAGAGVGASSSSSSSNRIAGAAAEDPAAEVVPELAGRMVATLGSGVSLGSGEYFIDVFVGTPPRHFSLILDTGSDLNWIQCSPCHDCFEQHGPFYDPSESSSFLHVPCGDPRCNLVSHPGDPSPATCSGDGKAPCPYFYWYGDRSNTTGDLALETFTVNLTSVAGGSPEWKEVKGVIFGCGHWNRGLFHGAAGLLGLGRGALSFSSQLRSLYGHTFSYCLVDRNSDPSVSSKLIFGEDQSLITHPELNYTSFVVSGDGSGAGDTFYYVGVKGVRVGGELLDIPEAAWELSSNGTGGTIIDSGTTLSYFAEPAYGKIKEAFKGKVKGYPAVEFPFLSPCYNVSGGAGDGDELPGLSIEFADGSAWNFPPENCFIWLEPEGIMCLAILGTPRSSLSIIGNYQQQNFHILYDTMRSRLGFAPMRCAEV